uniref:Transmembrane protein 68-like n=1 Tax=Dermatophagoides pteronyssinus TaxID=6956 RepID=A0A6P6XUB9_DERPT|nr:transmembrane protein 68-like [Dermatophagoides pteronyssinus]
MLIDSIIFNNLQQIDFIGINYLIKWIIISFIIIMLTTPFIYVLMFYLCSLILHFYRLILNPYYYHCFMDNGENQSVFNNDDEHYQQWMRPALLIAKIFNIVGRIWHGYEIIGYERIPKNGSAILVFYHSTLPNDIYYIIAKIFSIQKRKFYTIIDRIVTMVPGWSLFLNVLCITPGTIDDCVDIINRGNMLLLAPGGLREAMFSDENYQLIWNNRYGFARIARRTNVPIIPVFTKNSRESFRCLPILPRWLCRQIYDRYKIPIFWPFGGLPVKLTTIIGEPIHFPPEMTVAEIAELTAKKMEELIERHQTRPGSMWKALQQRFS